MPQVTATKPSPAPASPTLASSPIEILNAFLTEEELAKRLGVAVSTLRRWHARRTGPPRSTVGRKFYFSRQKLEEWIEAKALIVRRR
jgi:excisionase family DNA binding protein